MGKGNRSPAGIRRALAMLTLVGALGISLTAWASPAGAVIIRLHSGKKVSYTPPHGSRGALRFDEFFGNLDYNGGPVMPKNTLYPVYWAPPGSTAFPAGYKAGINTWL